MVPLEKSPVTYQYDPETETLVIHNVKPESLRDIKRTVDGYYHLRQFVRNNYNSISGS